MCLLSSHSSAPPLDDFMNDDMDAYLIAMDTSIAPGPSDPSPATLPLPSHSEQPRTANHRTRLEMEEDEEQTEETDAPPEKKVSLKKHCLTCFLSANLKKKTFFFYLTVKSVEFKVLLLCNIFLQVVKVLL